jgi:hypothetical protein
VAEAVLIAAADLRALLGQHERLDAAVAGVGAALGEACGLEPVGDAGHAGVVALERLRELAHRRRLVGLQPQDREPLLRREPELLRGGEHPAALLEEDPEHQLPCLLLGGHRCVHCHRAKVAGLLKILTTPNIYVASAICR